MLVVELMEKDYKKLIKSFTKKDYESRVNLHIHSNFSDGSAAPQKLITQAKAKGLEYIAISDHNTLNAYLKTDILKEDMLIPAIEFDCWFKTVFLHLLGYGFDVNNIELQSLCAKTKRGTEADWVRIFSLNHPQKVIKAIHNAGGIAVLAHPACCFTISIEKLIKNLIKLGLDGIEVYYPYSRHRKIIKFYKSSTIEKLADKYNLIKTGGSDEHGDLI
jgi:predicted metal-dependent phosphoesterase TrpH